jgi:ABC-type multidrug transport system ATPase subunit
LIQVHDLTVVFGRTLALDGVDVELHPGITGVFGPNGSGKSTLLRTLAGLEQKSSGEIAVGPAAGLQPEAARGMLGYAGHLSGLYPLLSLRENLLLFGRLYGVPAGAVDDRLQQLGLGENAGKLVRELSAGLKRRAAVARALLHDPEILLLDEPYANVDDEASDLISAAIVAWWRPDRYGLIATHGAKKVRAYAHAGLILQRGRVARYGTYTDAGFVRGGTT